MRTKILCEETTDVLLLQFVLQYKYEWEYDGFLENTKSNRLVRRNVKKNGNQIEISSCGGINNIPRELQKLKDLMENATKKTEAFDRVIVMIDHDTVDSNQNFLEQLSSEVGSTFKENQINGWSTWKLTNSVLGELEVALYIKSVPEQETGAIESVMLEALDTDETEQQIINKSRMFIEEVATGQSRYLQKKSRQSKAVFNTYFAIRTPEEKYDERAKILRAYEWKDNEVLKRNFSFLDE